MTSNYHFIDGRSGMVIVSKCPRCGAPIYAPNIWHGNEAPPISHTCECRKRIDTSPNLFDPAIGGYRENVCVQEGHDRVQQQMMKDAEKDSKNYAPEGYSHYS